MEKVRNHSVWLIIALSIIFIASWQYKILKSSISDDYVGKKFARRDATGLNFPAAASFTYFYYYLNFYPVTTEKEYLDYSKEHAQKLFDDPRVPLNADNSYYILWGEHGKSLILLFDAFLKQSPQTLTLKNFNYLFFSFALVLLLIFAVICKQAVFGIVLVLFMGSNPFLIYELYGRENIFGLGALAVLFSVALLLPLIFEKKELGKYYLVFVPVLLGLFFGLIAHIRTEYLVVMLSCILVFLFAGSIDFKKKIFMTTIFLLSFVGFTKAVEVYFNRLIERTYTQLHKTGRTTQDMQESRANYHSFWQPFYLGLSDFDNKYGITWSDAAAYKNAEKYLLGKYPEKYKALTNRELWSVQREYNEFLRYQTLLLIKTDPLWYLTIIGKRLFKIFNEVVPLGLAVGSDFFKIPFSGWLLLPSMILLCIKKRFNYLMLLLFPLSLSIPIVAIHSAKGITSISVYHMFNAAVIISLIINYLYKTQFIRGLFRRVFEKLKLF